MTRRSEFYASYQRNGNRAPYKKACVRRTPGMPGQSHLYYCNLYEIDKVWDPNFDPDFDFDFDKTILHVISLPGIHYRLQQFRIPGIKIRYR